MPQIVLIIVLSFFAFTSLGIALGLFFASRPNRRISEIEAITEHLPNITFQGFDKNGKIFLWNKASEAVYGYKRREAVGRQITHLIVSEDEKASYMENVRQVYGEKKALLSRQWTMITHNGEKKAMYSTMFPYLRRGVCEGIYSIDIDITNIKKYEEELTLSMASYKSIFEGFYEAILVYEPVTLKVIDVNARACEMFEYPKEKLIQLTLEDISYGNKGALREKTNSLIAEGPNNFEWFALSKSGEIFPVEMNLKKGLVGEKECALAIVRDISSRVRVEEDLLSAEKRYRDLLQNSNSLIFTLSEEGFVTSINSAVKKILNYEEDHIFGKKFIDFIVPEEKQKAEQVFRKVILGNQSNIELKCLSADKREVILLVNVWAERDRNNEIIGIHGDAADITDQKTVLERIREMVIQLVSMLSETVSVADRYTEKHCERIQEFALEVGKKLQLDEKRMEHLKFAALLHDVGKVGIPINILIKKGRLTEEEWTQIKDHPKKGADIVRQLNGFEEVAQIIEQHQERIDGKGYPQGLTKEQIRKEATIISVVDAFDAMTSDRPYRKAMSMDEAVEELRRNSGTQFDPEVVEAFIEVIKSQSKDIA